MIVSNLTLIRLALHCMAIISPLHSLRKYTAVAVSPVDGIEIIHCVG